ncbi:MAG: AmmeMemoRadiSam system protein B [Candidatus Micrarchaeota archaeon]|nr:AmmeMemoRadiSam system protein B [Candidatus Micrarchaeota archaeon]
MVRKASVAGTFYPGTRKEASGMLAGFEKKLSGYSPGYGKIFAVVAPHAGWAYSGFTAAHAYAALRASLKKSGMGKKPRFVILCPNHTGAGAPVAASLDDWETPLGTAKCDRKLVETVSSHSEFISPDEEAHRFEHSAEVQLPFLQHFFKDFSFAAICMGHQGMDAVRDVAKALWKASEKTGFTVIASSDFTHYEPAGQAGKKDLDAIGFLKKLDADGFAREVEGKRLSICGHGPITAACIYSKLAGAKKGELLHFSNSGEATGEESVVDYAAIAFV